MGICVACNADVEEMEAHKAQMHPNTGDSADAVVEGGDASTEGEATSESAA